jgi:hypothetical protein
MDALHKEIIHIDYWNPHSIYTWKLSFEYITYNLASKYVIVTNPIYIPSTIQSYNVQIYIRIAVLADLRAYKDKVPILESVWQQKKFLQHSSMNINTGSCTKI